MAAISSLVFLAAAVAAPAIDRSGRHESVFLMAVATGTKAGDCFG